jgi:FMN-dependent NADH-azoreductase
MVAMTKLLHIISSPRGPESESNRLAAQFLDAYLPAAGGVEVDTLDLWDGSLPVFGGRGVEAKMNVFAGQEPAGAAGEAWDDVKRTFDRFAAADEYLITVPMWNHGVPWVLKHYIDTISQPGMLFGFDPVEGYTGLVTGRRAMVVYTSAVYGEDRPARFGLDFHASYFRDWLRFAGITDVREARFQPNLATDDADARRRVAERQVREAAARWLAPPARLAA